MSEGIPESVREGLGEGPGRGRAPDQTGKGAPNSDVGGDSKGVVLVPLDGFRVGQAQLAEFRPERHPRHPQDPGGLELVAAGRLEHQRQEELLDSSERLLIELIAAALEPVPDK